MSQALKSHEEVNLLDRLVPKDDVKQQIRLKRALQAMGGGVSQSLVSVILFLAGGFRIELQGFILNHIRWSGTISKQ